jgi:hypothetical protein
MLIGSKYKYTKVAFENESEIEEVVNDNSELLFGSYAIFLPKSKIATVGGKGTIPDGIVIDLESKEWYVVETERASHGTWEHIAPQVSKQLTAVLKQENLDRMLGLALEQLKSNEALRYTIVDELRIPEIGLHGRISDILKKPPIVAIPIDEVPADLMEWARTLKHVVKVWQIEKFSRVDGSDILYSFPDEALPEVTTSIDLSAVSETPRSGGELLRRVIKAGLLNVGETLTIEYGPRGQNKQTFNSIVKEDGLEVDGKVYSPSYAAVACIRKTGSDRRTANGWTMWKNSQGILISDLTQQLPSEE